jgi:hypothetical protein
MGHGAVGLGLGLDAARRGGTALGVAPRGAGAITGTVPGRNVSGSVARLAAAASVGKYKGPCCPQPDKTVPARPIAAVLAARARRLIKIRFMQNILKL